MIRMTVRYPYKLTPFNGAHLFSRDLMRERPAAKVCIPFNPWVSDQYWSAIMANKRCIANRLKAELHGSLLLTAAPDLFEVHEQSRVNSRIYCIIHSCQCPAW